MKQSSYSELLKDPRWQKKRLKILEYAEWRCQICGRSDLTLHVHHSRYVKGKLPWQYPDGSLISVCEPHHDMLHPEKKKKEPEPEPETIVNCQSSEERFAAMRRLLSDKPLDVPWPWSEVIKTVRIKRPLIAPIVEDSSFSHMEGDQCLVVTSSQFVVDLLEAPNNRKFIEECLVRARDGVPTYLNLRMGAL